MVEGSGQNWEEDLYLEGDPFHVSTTVLDVRIKDTRRDPISLETAASLELVQQKTQFVDKVFEEIAPSDVNQRIDQELISWVKRIVFYVTTINNESGFRPISNSELRILVWEMWYVDNLHGLSVHGQKERHDGTSYPRTHLFESLLNGLKFTGITDLAFLLALLHHDDLEDLSFHKPDPSRDLLTDSERYRSTILQEGDMTSNTFGQLNARLFDLVAGVTNLKKSGEKKPTEIKELETTKDLIGKMLQYEPLVIVIRACERLHNLETLEGMRKAGKMISANGKIAESLAHLAPIVLSMGFRDLYKRMVTVCFGDVNRGAIQDFESLQQERLNARIGDTSVYRERLDGCLEDLKADPKVLFLAYRPKPFAEPDYADRKEIFNPDYKPSEKVDALDPLFRVEILVSDDSDIDRVKAMAVARLSGGVNTMIQERRGIVYIYNIHLGGRIEFRVRGLQGLRRDQSGVLKPKSANYPRGSDEPKVEGRLPRHLSARFQRLQEQLTGDTTPEQVRMLIREELLQPVKVALTPGSERDGVPQEIELPADAVVLDFALHIHKQILEVCQGALCYDSPASGKARVLAPFDRVFSSGADAVDPMISVTKGKEPQVSPSWVTYTRNPYTITAITELLRRKTPEEKQLLGKDYCEEIRKLLGLSPGVLEHFLLDDSEKNLDPSAEPHRIKNFHQKVGCLAEDPLKMLADKLKVDQLDVGIDFSDEPEVLKCFLTRFGRSFINLSFPEGQIDYLQGPNVAKRTKLKVRLNAVPGVNVSTYDLLSLIYQISRVHPLRIEGVALSAFFSREFKATYMLP